jgi:hypothetical protein
MPNCDFGKPCDCVECSTVIYLETCPKCGKVSKKETRTKMTYFTDRKGNGDYTKEPVADTFKACEICTNLQG